MSKVTSVLSGAFQLYHTVSRVVIDLLNSGQCPTFGAMVRVQAEPFEFLGQFALLRSLRSSPNHALALFEDQRGHLHSRRSHGRRQERRRSCPPGFLSTSISSSFPPEHRPSSCSRKSIAHNLLTLTYPSIPSQNVFINCEGCAQPGAIAPARGARRDNEGASLYYMLSAHT